MNTYIKLITLHLEDSTIESIFPSLIDTSVSMAGFILAALTIIVTFKSNLKAKGVRDSENALEMILSSKNYSGIVKTFKGSIFELSLLSIALYVAWLTKDDFSASTKFKYLVSGILILSLGIGRSILLLFRILKMEK